MVSSAIGCAPRITPAAIHTRCTTFVNEGSEPWQALFIKAPHVPGDGVVLEWHPGEPVPSVTRDDDA